MQNLFPLALVVLAGCAGGDPSRPSSPRDAANPRAPEPAFDPGPNPLVRTISASPGPGAMEGAGHAGHGAPSAPVMSAAPAASSSSNPHAGHSMPAGSSGAMAPMPMPMPMPNKQP